MRILGGRRNLAGDTTMGFGVDVELAEKGS